MITPTRAALLDSSVLANLAGHAEDADRRDDWPAASWQLVRQAGVLAWSVPGAYGGLALSAVELLVGYEQLASACLTTAFILSQREAAVRRLDAYPVPELQQRFLPALWRGELFATVGLSQLTTSRQHQAPALLATPAGSADHPDHYQLDGVIPWVTGADQADLVIVGAVLPDGRQVLVVLPAKQAGMSVAAPLPLLALAGSRTAQIHCAGVRIPADLVLAGPGEKLLAQGKGGVGGLETSCLALGLARAAVAFVQEEANQRPPLRETALRFTAVQARLAQRCTSLPPARRTKARCWSCACKLRSWRRGPPRQRWPWPRAPASSPRTRCSAWPGRPCSSWSGPVRAPSPTGCSPGSCPTERVV